MSLASRLLAAILLCGAPLAAQAAALRVCADPNNLPYSDRKGEGFENALAQLVAKDLGMQVAYTWWPQSLAFVPNTLDAKRCDVIMGVPAHYPLTANTKPYYRSTYVFVTRKDRHLRIASFDDPRLRTLKIGLHAIGDDDPPPGTALAERGIVKNIHGYPILGDSSKPAPARNLIDAVAGGEVDVAIAWGPLAGYFATREPVPLQVTPVSPRVVPPGLPMTFDIAMGVRRGDTALKARLDKVIERHRQEIHRLLARYGVPLVGME